MGDKPILCYVPPHWVMYRRSGHGWYHQIGSLDQHQGWCHILLTSSLVSDFFMPHSRVWVDKVATLPEVLSWRHPESSMVIFCLTDKDHVRLLVLKKKEIILQRSIHTAHFDEEVEKTKHYLQRFDGAGASIQMYPITMDDILNDFLAMPKLWCAPDHPLSPCQWHSFWYRWLPLGCFGMLGVFGVIGIWLISDMVFGYQKHHDLTHRVGNIPPVPEKVHAFHAYQILRKNQSWLVKLTEPLKKVLIGQWVVDDMEWTEKQLKVRFQIHPSHESNIPLKQQEIEQLYDVKLQWEVQNGYPTWVHLLIPLS